MYSDLLNGNICRFCLSDTNKSAVSLENSKILVCADKKIVDFKEILKYLLLNEKCSENLPNLVCTDCKDIIIKYFLLKKTFLENESTLTSKHQNLSKFQKLQKLIPVLEDFISLLDNEESINVLKYSNKIVIEKSSEERLTEDYLEDNIDKDATNQSKSFPIVQSIPENSEEEANYIQYEEEYIEDDASIKLSQTEEEQSQIVCDEDDIIYEAKNDTDYQSKNQEADYDEIHLDDQGIEDNTVMYENDLPDSKIEAKSKRKHRVAFDSSETELITKKYKVSVVDSNVVVQEDNSYMCSNCSSIFASEKAANEHVMKYGKFQFCTQCRCEECSVIFSSQKLFQKHKSFHILSKIASIFNYHDCLICNVSFGNEKNYERHMDDHVKNENYSYVFEGKPHLEGCEIFNQKEILSEHWSCGHCGMQFSSKNELNFHLTLFHANLYCPFDKQAYGKSVSYLIDHLKTKHPEQFGDEPITFSCSHCFEEFASKPEAREHEKTCSSKKFECSHCNKKFALERQLNEHLQSVNGNMKFACNFCDKRFNNKSSLTVHMRIHSKEKPYPCNFPGCNKTFRTNSHRSSHMDSHNETKIFKCQHCTCMFQTRAAKRAHEKSHNYSHVCALCQKDFKQRSHLVRHANIVHKIKCGSANLEDEINKHVDYLKKTK